MEQPNNQRAQAQPQNPARRDMMFCHECADEWYRDQHGLTCPECGSDFTEIVSSTCRTSLPGQPTTVATANRTDPANTHQIEDGNDPRDSAMYAEDDGNDIDSMPDLEDAQPNPDPRNNPYAQAHDDPDEEDISNVRFTQTAPGRFHVNATITRSVSPQEYRAAGGVGPGAIGGFMSMLNGIARGAAQPQAQPQGQGAGLFSGSQNQSAFNEARNQGQDGQPRVSRFTYTSGARMDPAQEDMTK
jgi:E3 ubiquitin-protein ligase RNF115/126